MNSLTLLFLPFVAFLSWLGTKYYISYARRQSILDIPNERSSHITPTPRGGGIVFTALFLAIAALMPFFFPEDMPLWTSLLGGGVLIAAAGWIDDRRGLSASLRLAIHALAVLWVLFQLGGMPNLSLGFRTLHLGLFGHALALLGGVWMINLYNFMDGIDGLAAGEAVIVAGAAGILTWGTTVSLILFALAAAVLGFLIWNRPPAKVFMGDVGSGFLGFVFFVFALFTEKTGTLPLLLWAVLLSVFVVDATLTLIKRARERKPLSAAHRDHLYQRAVLAGRSHKFVTSACLSITLFLCIIVFFFRSQVLLLFALSYLTLSAAWRHLYSKINLQGSPEQK